MNSLVDPDDHCKLLYEASRALESAIDLIVRGMCSLYPGRDTTQ